MDQLRRSFFFFSFEYETSAFCHLFFFFSFSFPRLRLIPWTFSFGLKFRNRDSVQSIYWCSFTLTWETCETGPVPTFHSFGFEAVDSTLLEEENLYLIDFRSCDLSPRFRVWCHQKGSQFTRPSLKRNKRKREGGKELPSSGKGEIEGRLETEFRGSSLWVFRLGPY